MINDKSFDTLISQFSLVKYSLREKNLDKESYLKECIEMIMKVVCFDYKDTSPTQDVRNESVGIKKMGM